MYQASKAHPRSHCLWSRLLTVLSTAPRGQSCFRMRGQLFLSLPNAAGDLSNNISVVTSQFRTLSEHIYVECSNGDIKLELWLWHSMFTCANYNLADAIEIVCSLEFIHWTYFCKAWPFLSLSHLGNYKIIASSSIIRSIYISE